ncbi:DUF4174 domain-containing protein [Maribacter spongiicola]|nr:DUF4174 domain-containing protein [Maribacter spongiicola]
MKYLKIIFIFILMHSFNMEAQDLSDYKWKNRIVILYENDTNTADVKSTIEIIDNNASKFSERAILVFVYKDNLLYSVDKIPTDIKKSDILPETYDGYILIGKDGGIKSKTTYPFNLEKLLDLIDSMPMRKSEMRYNK